MRAPDLRRPPVIRRCGLSRSNRRLDSGHVLLTPGTRHPKPATFPLLTPQRYHRINPGGASGWNVAGEKCNDGQEQGNGGENEGIRSAHAK